MSILSIKFILFLFCSLLVYYLAAKSKHQWKVLLGISYCFYLFAGVKAIIFILTTSVSTFFAGLAIGKINAEFDAAVAGYSGPNPKMTRDEKKQLKAEEDKRKRVIMVMTLLLNFGILIALKYINAIGDFCNYICSTFHIPYEMPRFGFLIPLGISYYTFQAMGYIIDLYRRKYDPETSLPRFLLFVSFFPQLIQGPISRYDEFSQQLYENHKFSYTTVKYGIELMAWGFFKKLVISDRIAIMTGAIFGNPQKYGGFYLIVASVLSLLQLYTDFSGGIDITRGAAQTMGIIMPENFTRPFFSINLSEYWRRWHITLNNWWRDYIFYPLTLSKPFSRFGKMAKKVVGENFGKKLPILLAVVIIRVINSIWHGATSGIILGGIYHGLLLALSFYFEPQFRRMTEKFRINTECLSWKVFQCLRTFVLIAAPRILSNAKSLKDAANYIRCLFRVNNPWILFDGSLYELGISMKQFNVLSAALLLLFVVSCVQEKGYVIREQLDRQNLIFRGIIYILFFYSIVLFGAYGVGYDASAFAYALI